MIAAKYSRFPTAVALGVSLGFSGVSEDFRPLRANKPPSTYSRVRGLRESSQKRLWPINTILLYTTTFQRKRHIIRKNRNTIYEEKNTFPYGLGGGMALSAKNALRA